MLHYVEAICSCGTTDGYNTEASERLHIDYAKEGYHASNNHSTTTFISLSKITEITEDSRPSSMAVSTTNFLCRANPTPDALRRSALLGGGSASHLRTSTESGPDPTLPPPGRLNELRAVFESQSPAGPHPASTPGFRSSSPMFGTTTQTSATGYGYGSTSYASHPSSPSKSGTGSSGSYTGPGLLSPLLTRPTTISGFRSTPSAITCTGTETFTSPSYMAMPSYTATPSYTAMPSYTATNTNTWSNVNTQTRTGYTTLDPTSNTYSDTDMFTCTSVTPPSGLCRPQTSPRSPLASVRNIVTLWKECTPAAVRAGEKSVAELISTVSPPLGPDGLQGIQRRVEGAHARLREARAVSNPPVTPIRPENDSADNRRSSAFPPGIDISKLPGYAKSNDPVSCFVFIQYNRGIKFILLAYPYRTFVVSQHSCISSLLMAKMPGPPLPSHASTVLVGPRWRLRHHCFGPFKLFQSSVCILTSTPTCS